MAENLDPVVHIRIEGKGYDGEEWNASSGTPGECVIYPESSEEQRAVIEALRAHAVKKLDYFIGVAAVVRAEMDFSLPNQPLRTEVESVHDALEKATAFARILVELAPWLYEDEDDGGDPEPAPDPAGSTHA